MYEILKKQYDENMPLEFKIAHLREFLQILILKIIYDKGYFKNITFTGGTALRIIYNIRRFSEEIDFSLTKKRNFNFNKFLSDLEYELKQYGLDVEMNKKDEKTAKSIMIKFKKILFKLGLSQSKEQKLSVKLEIDTKPPSGWNLQMSLISKTFIFTVTHFDLPSLYATKLHACFFRKYTKGRDIYDLLWYLGQNIQPNFKLLNNAIKQTEKKIYRITQSNFKDFLLDMIERIDFTKAKKDVERFLIDKLELKLFNKNIMRKIIENKKFS